MPMRGIGMIGVTPPTSAATLHVIEGGLSQNYVAEAARAHEASGFDLVLGRLFVVVRGSFFGGAARRGTYRAARLFDRASPRVCRADLDGAQNRDLRSSE